MAKRSQFKMSIETRRRRRFSENFKRSKVEEIQQGLTKVSEVCRQYEVAKKNVYLWIDKYGKTQKKDRLIVEHMSDTQELLALKKKLAELERIIDQKQIQLDFKDKMIELAEEEYKIDIKKKYSSKPSSTTGKDENNTPSV